MALTKHRWCQLGANFEEQPIGKDSVDGDDCQSGVGNEIPPRPVSPLSRQPSSSKPAPLAMLASRPQLPGSDSPEPSPLKEHAMSPWRGTAA